MVITEVDPLNHYGEEHRDMFLQSSYLIYEWLCDYQSGSLVQHIEKCYGFGALHEITGGVIQENGLYQYPVDPDLFPIVKFITKAGIVYLYSYDILAICQTDEKPFVTRVD